MRVVLVSDFFAPHVGGMEQHVQGLARQLQLQDHEVFVATTEREDRCEPIDGVPVERISGTAQRLSFAFANSERRFPPPLVDPEFTSKFGRYLDRVAPDVVHAHGWIAYSVAAATARRRIPLVVTLHDYGYICPNKTLLRDGAVCEQSVGLHCLSCTLSEYGIAKSLVSYAGVELGQRQLAHVDAFIAVSNYVRERAAALLEGHHSYVIPNFLDPIAFHAQRDTSARSQLAQKYLLYVGVLAPFKGVDDLIAGFQIACRRSPALANTQLLLLGRAHPSRMYTSLPDERIEVIYNPPRGLVVEAIAGCQAMVVPSRWHEPCPTVVLEGVCAGRPMIGTAVGGIPDLLRDVANAQIVAPNSPDALANAIIALAERTECSSLMANWGGPEHYLALQPARVAHAITEVYHVAIANTQMRRSL